MAIRVFVTLVTMMGIATPAALAQDLRVYKVAGGGRGFDARDGPLLHLHGGGVPPGGRSPVHAPVRLPGAPREVLQASAALDREARGRRAALSRTC